MMRDPAGANHRPTNGGHCGDRPKVSVLALAGSVAGANCPTAERNTACRRLSATLQEWPKHLAQGLVYGESTMANLVMDIVLFFCTSTFVTAVVLAAAMLLI